MKGVPFGLAAAAALGVSACAPMKGLYHDIASNVDVSMHATQAQASKVTRLVRGVDGISESEEYFIGRAVSAQILARYKPLNDQAKNLYVQKVAQTVALASDRPAIFKGYHVQLLDSDEVNALSAPGGFIFVTSGLLKLVHSEDELACVLGHEIAHISKKHGLKTIQTARLTQAFTLMAAVAAASYGSGQLSQLASAFDGSVNDIVDKLVVNGYSRDKEYEADRFGAIYARSADYDPGALKGFLVRLGDASVKGGGLFKTHPAADKRISQLAQSPAPLPSFHSSAERTRRFAAAMGS